MVETLVEEKATSRCIPLAFRASSPGGRCQIGDRLSTVGQSGSRSASPASDKPPLTQPAASGAVRLSRSNSTPIASSRGRANRPIRLVAPVTSTGVFRAEASLIPSYSGASRPRPSRPRR